MAWRARYNCDLPVTQCATIASGPPQGGGRRGGGGRGGRGRGRGGALARPSPISPDGKLAAYIQDYNLWVRDVATGKETQLTTDGVKDFGYATDNAGWTTSDRPILLWSPDSKKSPPINRISAASAKCIWSAPRSGIPSCGLEISAARRRYSHHDSARHH